MKILLVYPNRYQYIAPPPVGLAYLVRPLIERGHEVKILDLMFSKHPHQDLRSAITTFKPKIAGFSIRNLDNQSMLDLKNPLPEVKELVAIAKEHSLFTILGGAAFTTFPGEMLKYLNADYGISGQGENSLPLLIEAIATGADPAGIPGLTYRNRETGSVIVKPPVISGYSGHETADWSLINLKGYQRGILTPPAAVVVKTGCPYECSFCDAPTTMGREIRLVPIDKVIDDIKRIKNAHHTRWFFLIGVCFNSPLDYAKTLLHRIIQEDLRIRFITRLYPIRGCFDNEFFQLYKKAGGYFSMNDFNSFSDRMLENYHKPFSVADIYDFSKMAARNGSKFGVELLFGGPGETKETIEESMTFLPKLDYSLLSYAIGIRISPHTTIYDIAKQEGQIKDSSELLFSKFYISKDLDLDWAKKYIDHSVSKYTYRYRGMLPIILRNVAQR